MRVKRRFVTLAAVLTASLLLGCGSSYATISTGVNSNNIEETEIETEEATTANPLQAVADEYDNPHVDGTIVYLTFDDGPSYLTNDVLDILDEYGVKATFFVTYRTDPDLVPCYKRIVDSGHTIGIHTACHNYDKIYGSMDAYKSDFNQIYDYIKEVTGVSCEFYRFPGGSKTGKNKGIRDSAKAWLAGKGITYYDWNVVTGDGDSVSAEEEIRSVLESIIYRNHPVVLAHDGINKEATVEALPILLSTLKDWGYTFAPITEGVTPIQQGVNW